MVRPKIAITITDVETLASLKQAKRAARKSGLSLWLELRIDLFRRFTPETIQQRIHELKKLRLPILATIRSKKEGGIVGTRRAVSLLSDPVRIELFRAILPLVDMIDIELNSAKVRNAIVPLARRKKKTVILSYHNFRDTPSESALLRLIRQAKRQKADIVKLAVTPKKSGDLARLLLISQRNQKENLIVLGMGPLGVPSRVLGFLFGSLLTYTYLGRKPHAPGQLSFQSLTRELKPLF